VFLPSFFFLLLFSFFFCVFLFLTISNSELSQEEQNISLIVCRFFRFFFVFLIFSLVFLFFCVQSSYFLSFTFSFLSVEVIPVHIHIHRLKLIGKPKKKGELKKNTKKMKTCLPESSELGLRFYFLAWCFFKDL